MPLPCYYCNNHLIKLGEIIDDMDRVRLFMENSRNDHFLVLESGTVSGDETSMGMICRTVIRCCPFCGEKL